MATPGISAPTDGRLRISDAYLDANAGNADAVIDVVEVTPPEAFEFYADARRSGNNRKFLPRGIHIDNNNVAQDEGVYAWVRGCLRDETQGQPMLERYTCGTTHPNRYRYIYPSGTTARGIKIHA